MEKLSKNLLRIGKEIINEEKKPMTTLTDDGKIKHEESKKCYLCNQPFNTNKQSKYYKKTTEVKTVWKNYKKLRDHCHYTGKYRGAAHSLSNLRYQEQRDIPVILRNGSEYDFHLIEISNFFHLIKDLAKEFRSDIYCLGGNSEKYISFSVKIDDKKIDNKTINYNLKFIDSVRFMKSSLDSLVNNLSEINIKTRISCKERN